MGDQIEGCSIIAKALKGQGVKFVFGVVGIPVIEIAEACMQEGIKYVEQSASYAAGAIGYLTGHPGVCLVVSGPGLVHALAGMANSWSNNWPMIVIAGSAEIKQENMGAFQEFPQVEACRLFTKFSCRPGSIAQIPGVVEKAVRYSVYGRPGACYIDIPGDYVTAKVPAASIEYPTKPKAIPKCIANPSGINEAVKFILEAKNPLIIIGKGAQYSRAEKEVLELVNLLGIPFLPTPMGKGLVNDDHPYCVAAGRSTALKTADVILLLGARLNWILHFGKQPRFKVDVKVIQIDISPEEFGTNIHGANSVYLWGHLPLVVSQLSSAFKAQGVKSKIGKQAWWDLLNAKCSKNKAANAALMKDEEIPMSYYRAFAEIKSVLPEDIFLVSEGANTMDIARTILSQHYPRSRLDAGSFGTMGVGLGFAIAAQLFEPERQVVCIQGDSAFGFSAMEIETVCRLGLPILFIIINNNGIYAGMDENAFKEWSGQHPSTTLSPSARYEQIAIAFGGNGYFCQTPDETRKAVDKCIKERKEGKGKCSIINVIISPYGRRKQQEFDWLTRSDPKI